MPRLTEEQLTARRSFIGASDISAIVGLNPYADAVDVLNEKLGYEVSSPGEATSASELGHKLEKLIIMPAYIEDQKAEIIPCGSIKHREHDWAAATLDAKVIGSRRGVECKAVGMRMVYDWDESSDDGVPHYVRCQAEWQMFCIDLDEVDVAALLGGTKFKIYRIKSDPELRAHLVSSGEEFWRRHVLEKRAPELSGSSSVRTYLNAKYPPLPDPVIVPADADVTALVESRELKSAQTKEVETLKEGTTQAIIAWLGDKQADRVEGDGWYFQYRPDKNGKRSPLFKRKGAR